MPSSSNKTYTHHHHRTRHTQWWPGLPSSSGCRKSTMSTSRRPARIRRGGVQRCPWLPECTHARTQAHTAHTANTAGWRSVYYVVRCEVHVVLCATQKELTARVWRAWRAPTAPVVPDRMLERVVEQQQLALRPHLGLACAVGQTVILLHPPLPSAGVSTRMERGCQQNDRTPALVLVSPPTRSPHPAAGTFGGCRSEGGRGWLMTERRRRRQCPPAALSDGELCWSMVPTSANAC